MDWRVHHDSVREDAQGLFVPADELPEAGEGDAVTVEGGDAGARRGVVRGVVDDAVRGRYVIVDFDEQAPAGG
jgi:hypothetical protein